MKGHCSSFRKWPNFSSVLSCSLSTHCHAPSVHTVMLPQYTLSCSRLICRLQNATYTSCYLYRVSVSILLYYNYYIYAIPGTMILHSARQFRSVLMSWKVKIKVRKVQFLWRLSANLWCRNGMTSQRHYDAWTRLYRIHRSEDHVKL